MRAFRYRLAALLTRAEHAEHIRQMELARLQGELDETDRWLGHLRRLQRELRTRLRALLGGNGSASRLPPQQSPAGDIELQGLDAVRSGLERVDLLLQRAHRLRRALDDRVHVARDSLLEAARSRQMLENHRHGLSQSHLRAELAEETKQLDDLAAGRRGGNGPRSGVPS